MLFRLVCQNVFGTESNLMMWDYDNQSLFGMWKWTIPPKRLSIFCKKSGLTSLWWKKMLIQRLNCVISNYIATSMPTGFFIWGYMHPFTFIFGGTSKFWRCNVPSNSSFGGTKKMNCIFSTQGRAPCCFCKYYAELAKTFFFCLTHGLCVCPTIFL